MTVGELGTLTAGVRGSRVDPRELCDAALSAAGASGAFWELASRAEADAKGSLELLRRDTNAATLVGVPTAVKDSFAVRGLRQHLGLSRVVVSDRDAAAVTRLRCAGAIVIGTTAMDQLAWTMTGQAPGYPPCDNPLTPGRSPGGSSGGAAAAVAAGIVPLALGMDSAGSVRVPAAWCGVVGFKPTFGAIELTGSASLAPALDTAGILARHVDDCRLAFSELSPAKSQAAGDAASPRLGIPTGFIAAAECDGDVRAAWATALDRLTGWSAEVFEVASPPRITGIGALFAANLASRWGAVVDAEPAERVHPDVRTGVDYGRELTVPDYIRADDALAAARRQATSMFAEVDLLVMPTVPILAPPLYEPAPVRVASALTRPWSAFGWPAISIPSVNETAPGFGIQLVARPGDDLRLLSWAHDLHEVLGEGARTAP